MTFTVTTHLNFRGQARAALAFYKEAFGGEETLMTYEAMGQTAIAQDPDHIMWGQLISQDGFRIMAFDVRAGLDYDAGSNAFYVSLSGTDADEVRARWSKLSEGAAIARDLAPAPWSPLYGMLTDRFGIIWIVDVEQQGPH